MKRDISEILYSNSPKMIEIKTIVNEVAKTNLPVLIRGESGSGKGWMAQEIHRYSQRKSRPFVRVNCSATYANFLEGELFGYEKGALPDAYQKKPGKFEIAQGGTVLFKNIEEMALPAQAKLLQFLEGGSVTRVGGEEEIPLDVRVIAATKNHIERSIAEGKFREELFLKINVINILLPPLRERVGQIIPLTQYFFDLYCERYMKKPFTLSEELLDAFRIYPWPGNIRELDNFVKRVVLLGEEGPLLQTLQEKIRRSDKRLGGAPAPPQASPSPFNLKEVGRRAAEQAEKNWIEVTLKKTCWNRKEAAKLLRTSYRALHYKIQRYQLEEPKQTVEG